MPVELRDRCVAVARAALPNEACALIAGREEVAELGHSAILRATGIHPVANALASPTAFSLDGAGMIAAETRIDEQGERVIGVMHSHPTSQAYPSVRDLADAEKYDPHAAFVHLIVSMQGFTPTLRAFRYVNATDDPVELVLVSSDAS